MATIEEDYEDDVGGYSLETLLTEQAGRACGMFRRHARCNGSGTAAGRTQGGARWMNYSPCPECGRKVAITKTGKLRSHRA